jgi:hypothetical protein
MALHPNLCEADQMQETTAYVALIDAHGRSAVRDNSIHGVPFCCLANNSIPRYIIPLV